MGMEQDKTAWARCSQWCDSNQKTHTGDQQKIWAISSGLFVQVHFGIESSLLGQECSSLPGTRKALFSWEILGPAFRQKEGGGRTLPNFAVSPVQSGQNNRTPQWHILGGTFEGLHSQTSGCP